MCNYFSGTVKNKDSQFSSGNTESVSDINKENYKDSLSMNPELVRELDLRVCWDGVLGKYSLLFSSYF